MTRALDLLRQMQRMILEYVPEDPTGRFPTTPEEELLDELDSMLHGAKVGAALSATSEVAAQEDA